MSGRERFIIVVRLVSGLFFLGMALCLFAAYGFIGGDRLPGTPEPNGNIVFLPLMAAFLCWAAAFALKRWLNRAEAEMPPERW